MFSIDVAAANVFLFLLFKEPHGWLVDLVNRVGKYKPELLFVT